MQESFARSCETLLLYKVDYNIILPFLMTGGQNTLPFPITSFGSSLLIRK